MSLIDTTDGILMVGAYDWAVIKPIRKLYYNLTITSVSVVVAVLIAGIEALGLLGDQFELKGRFWSAIGALNDNLNALGFAILALFIATWVGSVIVYRYQGSTTSRLQHATTAFSCRRRYRLGLLGTRDSVTTRPAENRRGFPQRQGRPRPTKTAER